MKTFLKYATACFLTFLITGMAMLKEEPPEVKVVKVKETTHEVEEAPEVDITCDTFEYSDRIDCVDGYTGDSYGSFPIPTKETPAPTTTTLPKDSESDDPSMRAPEGYFLTPCQEDETPVMVMDKDRALPPGNWYTCLHNENWGEVGTYALNPKTGYLEWKGEG